MRYRLIPFGLLVLCAALLFVWLASDDEPGDRGVRDDEARTDKSGTQPALHGRAPPPAEPAQLRASGSGTAPKAPPPDPAARPAPKPPKRPTVGRLAEASGDEATATLRVRAVDERGHARERAHLVLYTVEKGVGRKSYDEPMGTDGEIVVEGLAPGRRTIYVRIGSLQRSAPLELAAGRVTEAVVPLPLGASVAGVVRHLEKGPLGHIMLRLEQEAEGFRDAVYASSDDQGRYHVEDIPPGSYSVALTGKPIGFSPRPRLELVVHATGEIEHDFVLGHVVLQGTVREAGTQRALAGVKVNLQNGLYVATSTNAQGAYEFRDVAPGTYTIAVSKDGYGFQFLKSGPIGAGTTATIDIELQRAAALEMQILDGAGRPIVGEVILSIVPIDPKDGTSLTTNLPADAEGTLRYARIVPGTYSVGVSVKGYGEVRKEVDVDAGATSVRYELKRTEPLKPVWLTGIVRDAVTREPIAGARIVVQSPRHGAASSDEDGVYRVRDLAPGTCVLHVGRDGYGIRFLRGVEIEGGKQTTLDLELQPAAVLQLRLTTATGEPVVGAVTLSISPREGSEGTRLGTGITADTRGNATYRQIVPGQYTLSVSQERAGRASIEAEIRDGTNVLDLRLR